METVRVEPGRLPPTISTTPNSPTVWAKVNTAPATMPGRANGMTMRPNVRSRDAPRHQAVSIRLRSTAANAAANGVVIVPQLAAPATALGVPRLGVFRRLKTSARTSIARLAPTDTRRMSATSTFRYDGPRTGFRDADPIVNGCAMAKAAVLNH